MFVSSARVLLLLSALLLPSNQLDELAFRPAVDRVIVKTFEVTGEGDTTSEFDGTHGSGSSTTDQAFEQVLVVTDRILAVDGDRVTKLERTYDTIASEGERSTEGDAMSHESSQSGESDAEGATVLFEWDDDEEDWIVTSDDLDDDVLLELRYDLDFLALLPDGQGGEVAEGDEWTIDAETWEELGDPWDGLPWTWTFTSDGETQVIEEGEDDERPEPDEERWGEVLAAYVGTRDVDGVTVGVIELEGTIDVEQTMEHSQEHEQGSMSSYRESAETRSISGEVLWLLDEGRVHSAEIEVESDEVGFGETTGSFGDREFETTYESETVRALVLSVRFEPGE